MTRIEKTNKMFEMLDLFYANKHLHDKIKNKKEKESFKKILKKEVDKLKQA